MTVISNFAGYVIMCFSAGRMLNIRMKTGDSVPIENIRFLIMYWRQRSML